MHVDKIFLSYERPTTQRMQVTFTLTVPKNYTVSQVEQSVRTLLPASGLKAEAAKVTKLDAPHPGQAILHLLTRASHGDRAKEKAVDKFCRGMGKRYGLGDVRRDAMLRFAEDAQGGEDAHYVTNLPGVTAATVKIVRELVNSFVAITPRLRGRTSTALYYDEHTFIPHA